MGMFDSIMVPCPNCGKREEFQSKSGPCEMITVDLENCPDDIFEWINSHSPQVCMSCGTLFCVNEKTRAVEVWANQFEPDSMVARFRIRYANQRRQNQ